jgi:ribosome-associated protein
VSDSAADTIQLDQFLKLNNVVSSGGEAKHVIQSGNVFVNDEVETRRGRKLKVGDTVRIGGDTFTVQKD